MFWNNQAMILFFFLLSIDNPFPHEPIDPTLLHQRAFYPSSPLEILPLTHSHILQQNLKTQSCIDFHDPSFFFFVFFFSFSFFFFFFCCVKGVFDFVTK
jgi:hypothetical protein